MIGHVALMPEAHGGCGMAAVETSLEAGGSTIPGWFEDGGRGREARDLDARNLGTLGGGNHFIDIQASGEGRVWLMLHSGSRNLGYRIADFYRRAATRLDSELGLEASDRVLAWLPAGHEPGRDRHRARQHGLALQHRRGPRQPRVLRVLRPRREPPHGPHRGRGKEKLLDLSEAPLAYKDIDEVMAAQADLVRPLVKLRPLAAVKG